MTDKSNTLNWALFLPPRIRLRVATQNDRAVRALLYSDMRSDENRSPDLGKEQNWQDHLADQFKLRDQQIQRDFPNAVVLMIEARGGAGGRFAIVGTVILDAGQTPERVKIARIVTIELSKSARGRNIGSQVIEALSASARAYGARRLETRIPADNPRLDAFCSRLGFRPAQMADHTATEGSHDVNGYRAIVRELKQS